ncbi:uncharacterized protein BJ171DRAFT_584716 [Polychytrium aggregatum]|uniref:uncharacterized protein n=1 Tax=Polychytrium aggregatum TaxID=110093 RepID=UPI0022FF2260|nr:uncharacterized protein BJ171DRAFT_584716 [Polychytrium aggregatum]KAI9201821.1 hypothetical protein BJ171DRAFT_584716 [Polychytrium aggregatum]
MKPSYRSLILQALHEASKLSPRARLHHHLRIKSIFKKLLQSQYAHPSASWAKILSHRLSGLVDEGTLLNDGRCFGLAHPLVKDIRHSDGSSQAIDRIYRQFVRNKKGGAPPRAASKTKSGGKRQTAASGKGSTKTKTRTKGRAAKTPRKKTSIKGSSSLSAPLGTQASTLSEDSIGKPDIVFSFDATGSMYTCFEKVRQTIKNAVTRLLTNIPDIRIALIAHGDYDTNYVTNMLDFSADANALVAFIDEVQVAQKAVPSRDYEECYEYILREVRTKLSWRPPGESARSLVMIGDAIPHPLGPGNPYNIDWRAEATACAGDKIRCYAVQCFSYASSRIFYQTLATITKGVYLSLAQFEMLPDLLIAICLREGPMPNDNIERFTNELRSAGRFSQSLHALFAVLTTPETHA